MSERCFNCFQEKETAGPCPHCGWDGAGQEPGFPPALKPGSILNGLYTVGRVLRRDSTSVTYIAQDYQSGERVTIKEYLPEEFARRAEPSGAVQLSSDEWREAFTRGRERFLQEVKNLAAFREDPCFPRIIRYFEENGTVYFVTDYMEGLTLDQFLAHQGRRLSPEAAGKLLLPLMEALERVHEKDLLLLNVAPETILIGTKSPAKLIDFSPAPLPDAGESLAVNQILRHGFAAREQYSRSGRLGPHTDVYAMGATWYYALTGKTPPDSIERGDEDELIAPSTLGVPISGEAEDALLRALEVYPQRRFEDMKSFRLALEEGLKRSPDPRKPRQKPAEAESAPGAEPAPAPEGERPHARRRSKALPILLIVLALACAAVAWYMAKQNGLTWQDLPRLFRTESAEPAESPEPTESAEAAESPEPAESAEATETPAPTASPALTASPAPDESPAPDAAEDLAGTQTDGGETP